MFYHFFFLIIFCIVWFLPSSRVRVRVCVCDDDGVCVWSVWTDLGSVLQPVCTFSAEGRGDSGGKETWTDGLVTLRTRDQTFTDFTTNLQSNRLVSLEPLTLNAPTDVPRPEGTTSSHPSVTAHERWKKTTTMNSGSVSLRGGVFRVFRWRTNGHPTLSFLFFCSVGLLETKNFACLCFCHLVRKKKKL